MMFVPINSGFLFLPFWYCKYDRSLLAYVAKCKYIYIHTVQVCTKYDHLKIYKSKVKFVMNKHVVIDGASVEIQQAWTSKCMTCSGTHIQVCKGAFGPNNLRTF